MEDRGGIHHRRLDLPRGRQITRCGYCVCDNGGVFESTGQYPESSYKEITVLSTNWSESSHSSERPSRVPLKSSMNQIRAKLPTLFGMTGQRVVLIFFILYRRAQGRSKESQLEVNLGHCGGPENCHQLQLLCGGRSILLLINPLNDPYLLCHIDTYDPFSINAALVPVQDHC